MGREYFECADCGVLKSKGYFPVRNGKRRKRCKDCKAPKRVTHPGGRESFEYKRSARLKHLYDMSLQEYLDLLESQGGRCAICGRVPEGEQRAMAVDHDHNCCPGKRSCGDCVRGLLCNRCNVLLGHAGDSPQILASAAQYLSQH